MRRIFDHGEMYIAAGFTHVSDMATRTLDMGFGIQVAVQHEDALAHEDGRLVEVLPVLEELHPGCSRRMAEQAERLSQLRDTQTELSDLVLAQLQHSDGLNRRQIGTLSSATRRQLLAQWLQMQGVPAVDAAQLDQLSTKLARGAPGGNSDLPGGWQLHWRGDALKLMPPAATH